MGGMTRRRFMAGVSAGMLTAMSGVSLGGGASRGRAGKLALLGGTPVRGKPFSAWPIWRNKDDQPIVKILRSGKWFRGWGDVVRQWEARYAELTGATACLGTMNGTNALLTALHVLDVGVGDEVIVPPYTFVATISVVLMSNALPVFADVDPETFQIDPEDIEKRITPRTRAIIPVHILGGVADMDRVNAVAKKHGLAVIEDACQAHLAQWRGKHVGTLGDLGCFSFQNSKNLPCGEGGAVIGMDSKLMDQCHSFTNCGRPYGSVQGGGSNARLGTNRRMTELQAAILLAQMQYIEAYANERTENAAYLTSKIEEIPGISVRKDYPGTTRCAYHLYALRYSADEFGGVPRGKFLEALRREGIEVSGGYGPLNKEGIIAGTLASKNFQRAFSKERLEAYHRDNECPANDGLCQQAVWLPQYLLLGTKADMDDIAEAFWKVYENRKSLV